MPQPCFDDLRERLLGAGFAPRHVSRYLRELRDHFDDLVREEKSGGLPAAAAQSRARQRLGEADALAQSMLQRPELRSMAVRFPWAVFGAAPVLVLLAALAAAILIEIGFLNAVSHFHQNTAHLPPPAWFVLAMNAWNAVPTLIAPLIISGILVLIGIRQRMAVGWIVAGVVIVSVLGGFQQLTFSDNGWHGELTLGSALFPPFPREMIFAGVLRAIVDVSVVAAVWWLIVRQKGDSRDVAGVITGEKAGA